MKVKTLSIHLDAIDPKTAIDIGKNVLEVKGLPITVAGTTSAKGYKAKRMGLSGGGNANTAKWRRRHGGAWVQPMNGKFKGGNIKSK